MSKHSIKGGFSSKWILLLEVPVRIRWWSGIGWDARSPARLDVVLHDVLKSSSETSFGKSFFVKFAPVGAMLYLGSVPLMANLTSNSVPMSAGGKYGPVLA